MSEWLGKTVVVTGAASGIGAAVVRQLLERGAVVAAWDLDVQGLRVLQHEGGSRVLPCALDVTEPLQVEAALGEVRAHSADIAGLVNAAGVLAVGSLTSDVDLPTLRRALAVNVEAVWLVSRAVARVMTARKLGSIVTVSSNAGDTPRLGLGAYCASKAAATMLTRCLALELAPHGVRCNVVSPGSTDTPMLRRLPGGADLARSVQGDLAQFRLGIPLGRVASPRDVADAVLFLLSDQARHITLHDLRVDGGATF